MLKITIIESQYSAPDDDEEDYCPEPVSTSTDETVGFRELVQMMRDYPHTSCWPVTGGTYEWLTSETHQDPYTGEYTECSLHYSRDNPPRMEKYWRAAMRAVGLIRL